MAWWFDLPAEEAIAFAGPLHAMMQGDLRQGLHRQKTGGGSSANREIREGAGRQRFGGLHHNPIRLPRQNPVADQKADFAFTPLIVLFSRLLKLPRFVP